MLRVLIVALVLLVAVMVLTPRTARLQMPEAAKLVEPPRSLPEVPLIDDTGQPFDWRSLRGKFALLLVGDSLCAEACAPTLEALAAARTDLAARAPAVVPEILFVSVDSSHDTPSVLRAYLDGYDAAWVGATAPSAELKPLLEALGVAPDVRASPGTQAAAAANVELYFLGPNTDLIAAAVGSPDAKTLVADYLKIRRRYLATHRTGAP
jgi:cytochrome oxidase Cu insertion factor (SCO1/SenC/PrrC family)